MAAAWGPVAAYLDKQVGCSTLKQQVARHTCACFSPSRSLSLSLFFFFLVLIDLSGLSLPERGHSAAEAVGPCVLYQGPSDSKSPILVD